MPEHLLPPVDLPAPLHLMELFECLGEAIALVVLEVPALETALDAKDER